MSPGTDIRYVCLSDLHLGEEDSLLTHVPPNKTKADPTLPSPVLQELVKCLRFLISRNQNRTTKPTLILNGDILELALANDNCAAMAFERFLEEVMPKKGKLFGKIFYIPGNHDHHLWESARETQYVQYYLPRTKPKDKLKIPWHATNIFVEKSRHPVRSFFLNGVMKRYQHLNQPKHTILTSYPNLGLRKGKRWVIFHHGHFIEPIYQLMTTLKNLIFPELENFNRKVWDLEAENFAWIDFFWSTLGRSGEVGKDVEIIYEKLQDETQLRKLLDTLADSLAKRFDLPGWGDWMESKITRSILRGLADQMVKRERTQGDQPLTPEAAEGLVQYVNEFLPRTLEKERKKKRYDLPKYLTFVFGHTHKPFEKLEKKFSAYQGDGVPVYNTGGWVVESVQPAPKRGGAVVLLNEDLDVVSLRMYNEAANPVDYQVKVHEIPYFGRPHSAFFQHLQKLVQPGQEPWPQFCQTVAAEVSSRAQKLQERIKGGK